MKRRVFVITTATGVAIVSAGSYFLLRDVEYDPSLAHPKSLSSIWDIKTIEDIGKKYRANTPGESSARSLVKLLDGKSLDQDVIDDFQKGNTVLINGWLLSLTEARQCALASTIESK